VNRPPAEGEDGAARPLVERCGAATAERQGQVQQLLGWLQAHQVEQVRVGWCDLHGGLRGKTLMRPALESALVDGVGLVSTLLLKDSADRTAFKVFDPGVQAELPGLGYARNLFLLPDPASRVLLPWAPRTAWLRGELVDEDGLPVSADPRRALQAALERLRDHGLDFVCGLEVEFHVYRIADDRLDPDAAAWPGEPPLVLGTHPGWNLLAESSADRMAEVFDVVRATCAGLGLPLRSLEVELGPSQIEAVFDACRGLQAADRMVLFRNGVRQALRRAGYHATFMCRPPFATVMSSGWHLHQSLRLREGGGNAFMRPAGSGDGAGPEDACHWLSPLGSAWLAGLLAHARGAALFGSSTVNAYGRFKPGLLAPVAARWGRDNRGAMLRVLGGAGDPATRIENRVGEPMANPYLYIASQVHAGLNGVEAGLRPAAATRDPYDMAGNESTGDALPASLDEALAALQADTLLGRCFAPELLRVLQVVKRAELARFTEATDKVAWMRREYFGRY